MIDATEFNIKRMQTVICALLSCGEKECMDLYELAKNGYLDEALKRVVEEWQEVPNFNNLWEEAICEAYVEIFGGDPAQELYLDANSTCSRVFRRVEYLNASLKKEFEEKTGYELEDAYDKAFARDYEFFNEFKDYILDNVAETLEVKPDGTDLVVPAIEDSPNSWMEFLRKQFDDFGEGAPDSIVKAVEDYLNSDCAEVDTEPFFERVRNRAIDSYKEWLETKKTEDELNRTYR